MFLTVATFFIILSVLILVHELGHFLVAKKAGIKVEEFGFGYPPRMFGKKIGETVYSVNWLFFGGFVKLYGEEYTERHGREHGKTRKRAFWAKSKKARTAVIVAGVLANFVLAIVVFSIVYSFSGIPVKTGKIKIAGLLPNSPAEQAGLKNGDIIREFNHQPIQKSDELISLINKNLGQTIILKIEGSERTVRATPFKYEVVAGDSLWKIAQKIYQNGYRWVEIAKTNNLQNPGLILIGEKLKVSGIKEEKLGGIFEVVLTPRSQSPQGEGPLGVIISNMEMKKFPFWQMPWRGAIEGFKEAFGWASLILGSLKKMVVDLVFHGTVPKDVAGPIGIFQITGVVAQSGLLNILQFMGILSVNLAVINILPLPALDGGRLVFIIYEAITRRKPKPSLEQWVNTVGMAFLLLLIILITINDIGRLVKTTSLLSKIRSLWPF